MTPEQYIAAARSYIGVPWQHQGRTRFGLDCVGLLICAAWDCGVEVLTPNTYGREPTTGELTSMVRAYCSMVSTQKFGDIITMGLRPTHVGILTDGSSPFGLIHVPTNGACCEVTLQPEACALRGTYRPKVF